jgi:hypothetical protein
MPANVSNRAPRLVLFAASASLLIFGAASAQQWGGYPGKALTPKILTMARRHTPKAPTGNPTTPTRLNAALGGAVRRNSAQKTIRTIRTPPLQLRQPRPQQSLRLRFRPRRPLRCLQLRSRPSRRRLL